MTEQDTIVCAYDASVGKRCLGETTLDSCFSKQGSPQRRVAERSRNVLRVMLLPVCSEDSCIRPNLRCRVGIFTKLGNPWTPSAHHSGELDVISEYGSAARNIHYFMKYCNNFLKYLWIVSDSMVST